jgi:capsular polysaccharide biosynthesis protein
MRIINVNSGKFVSISDAAIVVGSSLIYSQDFLRAYSMYNFRPDIEILQEEPDSRLIRVAGSDGWDFKFPIPPKLMGRMTAEIVPFNVIHPQNYFHFLIESLPSLVAMVRGGLVNRNTVIVTGLLHENMQSALNIALAGVDIPLLQLGLMQYVTSNKVITTTDSFMAALLLDGGLSEFLYDSDNLLQLRNIFRKYTYKATSNTHKKSKKLYVERNSQVRKLVNSNELAGIARSKGFDVVDSGALSFVEQAELFSAATHICGPTGAWVANLLFVPEQAKVTILLPDVSGNSPSMWNGLGAVFGIDVRDVLCPISHFNSLYPIHSDFYLDGAQFAELLDSI